MTETMVCENCGKNLGEASYSKSNCCKGCATRIVLKDLFTKTIFPVALAAFLLYMAYLPLKSGAEGMELYMKMLFFAGIPFGLKKMWVWLIPTGRGTVAESAAILVLDLVVGGVIGAFVLAWRMIYAVFNLIKSGVMLVTIAGASE